MLSNSYRVYSSEWRSCTTETFISRTCGSYLLYTEDLPQELQWSDWGNMGKSWPSIRVFVWDHCAASDNDISFSLKVTVLYITVFMLVQGAWDNFINISACSKLSRVRLAYDLIYRVQPFIDLLETHWIFMLVADWWMLNRSDIWRRTYKWAEG